MRAIEILKALQSAVRYGPVTVWTDAGPDTYVGVGNSGLVLERAGEVPVLRVRAVTVESEGALFFHHEPISAPLGATKRPALRLVWSAAAHA